MSAAPGVVPERTGGQTALALATSPHLHGWWTTSRLMWAVVISLVPCLVAGLLFFGWQRQGCRWPPLWARPPPRRRSTGGEACRLR
jgi:hypothetical protein